MSAPGKLVLVSWTIQSGQRLTTGPEQNPTCGEVTSRAKLGGWRTVGHNASEGIQPRNIHRCNGPRVSCPGSQQRGMRYGECVTSCRGLSPWQAVQRLTSEPGRASLFPWLSFQQAEEARRRYDSEAVGPFHSTGVAGVMPGEGMEPTGRERLQFVEGKEAYARH